MDKDKLESLQAYDWVWESRICPICGCNLKGRKECTYCAVEKDWEE